jgi:tetraacyldisaccharide-1-P 4'-kinase
VGDPAALRRQLEQLGASVRERVFADHHTFTEPEIAGIARTVHADEIVVCTLKDAVKIAVLWPRAAPSLWYVSQRVNVEEGVDLLEGSLDALLRARSSDTDAVRPGGPYL